MNTIATDWALKCWHWFDLIQSGKGRVTQILILKKWKAYHHSTLTVIVHLVAVACIKGSGSFGVWIQDSDGTLCRCELYAGILSHQLPRVWGSKPIPYPNWEKKSDFHSSPSELSFCRWDQSDLIWWGGRNGIIIRWTEQMNASTLSIAALIVFSLFAFLCSTFHRRGKQQSDWEKTRISNIMFLFLKR